MTKKEFTKEYYKILYGSRRNPVKEKPSHAGHKRIAKKIRLLIREGYPRKQAAAIAYKYEAEKKLGPRGGKKRNPKGYPKLSKQTQKRVSLKIRKLISEGYERDQAAAIAYKYARAHKLGPRGGKKRNPIEDKDMPAFMVYMMYISKFPEKAGNIPEKALKILSEEGYFSFSTKTL